MKKAEEYAGLAEELMELRLSAHTITERDRAVRAAQVWATLAVAAAHIEAKPVVQLDGSEVEKVLRRRRRNQEW